jgi:hypothetical protein
MATLSERLDVIQPQLEKLRNATEERKLILALRTRSAQVAARKTAALDAVALTGKLRRLGAVANDPPRVSASLRGKPGVLGKQLAESPESAIHASQWDASFLAPLDTFVSKLTEFAGQQWRQRVDELASPLPDDVLVQFEKIGFIQTVKEIRAAQERIRRIREDVSESHDALEEVTALNGHIKQAMIELNSVPDAVRGLFAKATTFEAGFEDLTDEVVAWLRAHDMLKSIRIGLR